MIIIKSPREIELMRRAGKVAARARALAAEMVAPGVKTAQIDREVKRFIESCGAVPTFLGYGGFPASTCISVNEVVIHGIPGEQILKDGDIVSIDVGATLGGYVGDCATTVPCGKISEEAARLIEVTRESFFNCLSVVKEGYRVSDIGTAISEYVEKQGFSVVRDYVGHGIGRSMHESPEVPNYNTNRHGQRLQSGMTLAIEPMINAGGYKVRVLPDKWTVVTADGSLSAHYENTVAITDSEAEILTVSENSNGL